MASGGRVDPNAPDYSNTYAGLDQVSGDWPATEVDAGDTITIDFWATAVHEPSVWDVWLTTPDWTPDTPLNWAQMEFLGRPAPVLDGQHYYFDLDIPTNRSGHHVIWIAWQRDDPVGEVFFSTSDIIIWPVCTSDLSGDGSVDVDDLLELLAQWGTVGGDINDDGTTDVDDLLVLLANWGPCA